MKTEQEVKQLIAEIENKMQDVNTGLENFSSREQLDRLHDKRRQLQAQYNILLEVLK